LHFSENPGALKKSEKMPKKSLKTMNNAGKKCKKRSQFVGLFS